MLAALSRPVVTTGIRRPDNSRKAAHPNKFPLSTPTSSALVASCRTIVRPHLAGVGRNSTDAGQLEQTLRQNWAIISRSRVLPSAAPIGGVLSKVGRKRLNWLKSADSDQAVPRPIWAKLCRVWPNPANVARTWAKSRLPEPLSTTVLAMAQPKPSGRVSYTAARSWHAASWPGCGMRLRTTWRQNRGGRANCCSARRPHGRHHRPKQGRPPRPRIHPILVGVKLLLGAVAGQDLHRPRPPQVAGALGRSSEWRATWPRHDCTARHVLSHPCLTRPKWTSCQTCLT